MDVRETILIIDDKPANILALEGMLEKPGRFFLKAGDGASGLKLALEEGVDLIVLDVHMPGMDGFEVAQVLKSHHRTRDIPIIFASAEKKERQSIMKGFDEGAFDYLTKPLDPDLTRAKVSILLQLQKQKKELIERNTSLERAEGKIKALNEDLQQKLAELKLLNNDLESFSYSVSHDLRSPLRSILGYSGMLQEDLASSLTEIHIGWLRSISDNANRMNSLIDDLLAFSKAAKKEIHKSDIDTAALVQRVIDHINQSVRNHASIQVQTLVSSYADNGSIAQVWTNLISNAVKYSSKRESPRIEIGSRRDGDENIFYVKDNGVGFDPKYADKLFGVFQRLHNDNDFEGTGVGLALVQRIVTKHGGRIWAESEVNKGATFYFALPCKDPV